MPIQSVHWFPPRSNIYVFEKKGSGCSSPPEVVSLLCYYAKRNIKPKKFFSFYAYEIMLVGESLIAYSNKEIRKIDIKTGFTEVDKDLTEKFNVNGVTANLGNGVSFISSISSLNQQFEDEAAAASSGGGAGTS